MIPAPVREAAERSRILLAPSRTKRLVATSVVVGLSTGVMAFLFDRMILLVRDVFLGGDISAWVERPLRDRLWLIAAPAMGGLLVGPLIVWLPVKVPVNRLPLVLNRKVPASILNVVVVLAKSTPLIDEVPLPPVVFWMIPKLLKFPLPSPWISALLPKMNKPPTWLLITVLLFKVSWSGSSNGT